MKNAKQVYHAPFYRGLSLRNFRGFKKAEHIPLAPLTFLVGPNSSGKSSLFDSLLLLAQSGLGVEGGIPTLPSWGGPLVDLGSFRDCVTRHNSNLAMEIAIDVPANFEKLRWLDEMVSDLSIRIIFQYRASARDTIGYLFSISIIDVTSGEKIVLKKHNSLDREFTTEIFGVRRKLGPRYRGEGLHSLSEFIGRALKRKSFRFKRSKAAWRRLHKFISSWAFWQFLASTQRVSSGRAGPKRWYPLSSVKVDQFRWRRDPGLFEGIDPSMVSRIKKEEEHLKHHFSKALSKQKFGQILRKLDIATDVSTKNLSPYHSAISLRDSITKVRSNIIDVGYGASQVMPVIWGCLSPLQSPLFVEQPEIHLHPKAQATIAELLCHTSSRRQVIVETHSEHMINRARILIARKKISAENVMILFVSRTQGGSRVQPIPILPNGDFGAEWPIGFFDERYQDTMQLLQLKGKAGEK